MLEHVQTLMANCVCTETCLHRGVNEHSKSGVRFELVARERETEEK